MLNWLPWKLIVSRVARSHGFIDPLKTLDHLNRFSQPSEVDVPIELLRAGAVFHARGLMNTKAIQHNLDWVWPWWVEEQFDPASPSFIPRGFSMTHINLTHRNWTALGLPGLDEYPLVDPRGLLTPFFDGWSLDAWVVSDRGGLFPSRTADCDQRLDLSDGVSVRTRTESEGRSLACHARVEIRDGSPSCVVDCEGRSSDPAWLVASLRPYNPEGVSLIHEIRLEGGRQQWLVDRRRRLDFAAPPDLHLVSEYHGGDVRRQIGQPGAAERNRVRCHVGMATAAALWRIDAGSTAQASISIPLFDGAAERNGRMFPGWSDELASTARLEVPEGRFQFLYDAALHTLVLHAPDDVYPGPYTYRRFWFRDAAFILDAMMSVGMRERPFRTIGSFFARQTMRGYFESQDGEWDSNGEALWTMERFLRLFPFAPTEEWLDAAETGGRWIVRKRHSAHIEAAHAGLLPAGFSAEHLGTNDFYYWDNFWSIAGLRAAATFADVRGDSELAIEFRQEASELLNAVVRSLGRIPHHEHGAAMPASPYRRMDSGAIGSVAADYPLGIFPPGDRRSLDTVEYLLANCFFGGGFFQDMIHSGINAYLTLHIAQVLLRAGDMRWLELARSVADLASPTGQWPEAIHPRTLGGCMGDGQHVWAAAEWVLMMRAAFVREEEDRLVLCGGIPSDWLEKGPVRFGPAPTRFGSISVEAARAEGGIAVSWQGRWHAEAPRIEVHLPGRAAILVAADGTDRVLVAD